MQKYIFFLLLFFSFHALAQQKLVRLSGKVQNTDEQPLQGVEVYIQNSRFHVKTNAHGEYNLTVPAGKNLISYSFSGYKTAQLTVDLSDGEDLLRNITLSKVHELLPEVTVTDQRSRNIGMAEINARDFVNLPSASQNFESLLKQLPGVSTNNELSSQYSVRGGNFDENLIYINDIEIYKPYLVRNGQQEGLSLINPDLAGNVKFSAGGFTPRYGDKMSSVLDVQYKNPDSASTIAGLGTNGTSVTTFFKANKIGVALAYRNKRNQSILSTQQVRGSYDPNFHDFQGILKYNASRKFNAEFLGIFNTSEFGLIPESRETIFGTLQETLRLSIDYEGKERDKYQNVVGALTLNYKPSNQLAFKWINSAFLITETENFDILGQYVFEEVDGDYLGGSFGKVRGNRGIGMYQDYGRNELLADIFASELKLNITRSKTLWEGGLRCQTEKIKDRLNEFNYIDSAGYALPNNTTGFQLYEYRFAENELSTNRLSGYIMNTTDLNGQISLSGGLRFNYNSFTKEFLPSPRLVFTYKPIKEKDIVYRLAGGLYVQPPFYREMRNFDGSINANVKSQKSLHVTGSSDYKFEGLGTQLRFTSEIYYKHLYDIIPYELENLRIRYLTDKLAKGYAMGLDFGLSGEFIRDLQSSFRLSLMKTEEDIDGDNLGYIKRPTDQRVNFSAFFQDRLFNSPTYKIHLNLLFGSKLPTWPPKTVKNNTNFYIPSYKRLDVGFSKDLLDPEAEKKIKFLGNYFQSFILYAEVFNLLNINNTVSYLWVSDVKNNRYAIPNYLTSRQLNFKIIAKF